MTHKYTSGKFEKRKPQKIGNSSSNDRAGARKFSIKKVFQENVVKITGEYLCRILFLCKVSRLLRHRYFPVNFAKLVRTTFSEHLRWLILSDLAKLKKGRTEHKQFKNESKTKPNTNSKLF